jgi:hypothetical protein
MDYNVGFPEFGPDGTGVCVKRDRLESPLSAKKRCPGSGGDGYDSLSRHF